MKPSKDASIFMGFYDMNFADGAEKFAGLLNTCQATGTMPGYASPQSHAPVPPRYPLPQVAGHSLPPLYPSSEPPRSQAYADGRRDRQAWEDWYNGLPEGAYRQGASYWASVRSTKQAASGCTGSGYTGSAEQANWVNGCYARCQRSAPRLQPRLQSRVEQPLTTHTLRSPDSRARRRTSSWYVRCARVG